ncbi:MAG: hypothetical protein FWC77_02720 [Defluviitaleaceae bacterium]|nr:hypothetical protein [Defluviitaleaceae bacterium]
MNHSKSDLTPYMANIISNVKSQIKTFYCREDFQRKVREVMEQQRKNTSAYLHRLNELKKMSANFGVSPKLLCDPKTHAQELAKIPSLNELYKQLIIKLHGIYLSFPSSIQFMERLVRRRLGDEFKADPIRLAILKKFVQETDYHTQPVIVWAKMHGPAEEKAYQDMDEKGQKEYIIASLDESIFANLTHGLRELDTDEWGEFLLRRIKNEDPNEFTVSKESTAKLHEALYEIADTGTPPGTGKEALQAIVNTMATGRHISSKNMGHIRSTLTHVENEFQIHLNQKKYIKRNGKEGTKDEIYKQAKKDLRRSQNTKWTLLKLADDLALGKFRVNGITKEQLYVFAIAFDMTVYFDDKTEIYDTNRDLEKNLFFDYYNDNLLRYILDDEYAKNNTHYETEPSGEGINYKNYVEVIYLYFICKNLSPREKLKRIHKVIESCVKQAATYDKRVTHAPKDRTRLHKERCIKTLIEIASDNELIEFICQNYYIYDPNVKSARILYASEQNTAQENFAEITSAIQEINHTYKSNLYLDEEAEPDYSIDIDSLLAGLKKRFGADEAFAKILSDKKFVKLLQKLDEKLHLKHSDIATVAGANYERDKFTRTKLIALYYSYYLTVVDDLIADYKVVDLPGLYSEFCNGYGQRTGINTYLEECRYQKISEKNIFDMFVVFAVFLEQIRRD